MSSKLSQSSLFKGYFALVYPPVLGGLLVLSVEKGWWLAVGVLVLPLAAAAANYVYNSQNRWLLLPVVTLVVGIGIGFAWRSWPAVIIPPGPQLSENPGPLQSATPTPATLTPTSTPPPEINGLKVTFEEPREMTDVPLKGVSASGRVEGSLDPSSTLWLFVLSPDDNGVHYATDQLSLSGGYWALGTGQIGSDDPVEVGKLFTLQVVLANSAATQEFDSAMAAENYQGWPELPSGAKVIAERVVRRN